MKKTLYYIIITFIFQNCYKAEFVEKKKIEDFKNTDFVVSLEQNFSKNNNYIYASSLLYAWDALHFKNIQHDKSTEDFTQLISSKKFSNTLDKDEIDIESGRGDSTIYAKASFKKDLNFEQDLDENDTPLIFNSIKVKNFGFLGNDYEKSKQSKILYYKNNDNFIIKLFPKDKEHEILIVKLNDKKFNSLSLILNEVALKEKIGVKEKNNNKLKWKYTFNEGDEIKIPVINFNIEKNFGSLTGINFREKNKNYSIEEARQSIAFLFNNKGAKVESEAVFEVATEIEDAVDLPIPKKLILDKKFSIFLKRKKSKYPYFACYINNPELLTRF